MIKILSQIPEAKLITDEHYIIKLSSRLPGLSSDEKDFKDAIYKGLVYPVFEPIVNGKLNIVGFEILCRWKRNDKECKPSEFLPLIQSRSIWLLLTSFMMNVAIKWINRFLGKVCFSVNIPPLVAESITFIRMMDMAKKQLLNEAWINKLIIEISEDTDLSNHSKSVIILQQLTEKGYQIYLDDCFSKGCMAFPIRQIEFNGYKLDLSIVEQMITDEGEKALVKLIIYYCRITGKHCIAEGVDSEKKLLLLKSLGVEYFQGYMISHPVPGDLLEITASRLGIAPCS